MEIEVVKKAIGLFDPVFQSEPVFEESSEAIVPDTYPDIGKIISASGTLSIRKKEIENGRGTISGVLRCVVLYTSETGSGIYPIALGIPVEQNIELPSELEDVKMIVRNKIVSCSASEVNPRKVSAKAVIASSVTVYKKKRFDAATEINCDKQLKMNMLKKQEKVNLLQAVAGKAFTVTDDLEIPSGKPAYGEILLAEAELAESDTKMIGNKAVVKGYASLKILYRDLQDASRVSNVVFELPFSQIVETELDRENCTCRSDFEVGGIEITPVNGPSGEGRTFSVSVAAEITVFAYDRIEVEGIVDAYSNAYLLSQESAQVGCKCYVERTQKKVQVRETIRATSHIREIIDVRVSTAGVTYGTSAEGRSVVCPATVNILYYTEAGTVESVSREIAVSATLDIPQSMEVAASAQVQGIGYTIAGEEDIDLHFNVVFVCDVGTEKELKSISKIELQGERDLAAANIPSITIKYAEAGESYWNIAKRHNTRMADIFAANGIEPAEYVEQQRLLLIPGR